MIRQMKITTFILALAMVAAFRVIACGSASDEDGAFTRESSSDAFRRSALCRRPWLRHRRWLLRLLPDRNLFLRQPRSQLNPNSL